MGFDTLIAERLLELRDIISPIKVILVLPFRSYQSRWTPEQQIRAAKIEARADKIVYCSDAPSRNAFLYRDRHLVNGSAYCIGYCTRTIGGSAYTLRYAREQGLTVWNIGEEVKP